MSDLDDRSAHMPCSGHGDLLPVKRRYNYWTSATLLRLRKLYPAMSRDQLVIEFAPHSLNAIYMMAKKLRIRKRRDWQVVAAAYKPVIFAP